MRGNENVLAALNEALREELTAINQYFVHAEMCHNWGYHKLGCVHPEAVDRRDEARRAADRAHPVPRRHADDGTAAAEALGGTVRAQLESDHALEVNAVAMYNRSVQVCPRRGRRCVAPPVHSAAEGRRRARRLARGAAAPDSGGRLRAVPRAADDGSKD